MTSRIPGFAKKTIEERVAAAAKFANLTLEQIQQLITTPNQADAEKLLECSIGWLGIPLGIVPNVLVNDHEYLVPYAIEEPSNISGPAMIATLVRDGGSLNAHYAGSFMTGQVQLINVPDLHRAKLKIHDQRETLLNYLRVCEADSEINKAGGGPKKLEVKMYEENDEGFLVVNVEFDTKEGLGAGYITRNMQQLREQLEELSGGEANVEILSNDAPKRVVNTSISIPIALLKREKEGEKIRSGAEVADRIVQAYHFAKMDQQRAVTYNKGIMNGMDAVLTATGNDTRAQEAAAHSYAIAAGNNRYKPLSHWATDGNYLVGRMRIPITLGTVGGITKSHPQVQACLALLGNPKTAELSELVAAMGLMQNLAANYTLVTKGIPRAHGGLNLYNLMNTADIPPAYHQQVFKELQQSGKPSAHLAREIYERIK